MDLTEINCLNFVSKFLEEILFLKLMSQLMHVCEVVTFNRAWINRVRLLILIVASRTGNKYIFLSLFTPENLASLDWFGRPDPRQPAYSPYLG